MINYTEIEDRVELIQANARMIADSNSYSSASTRVKRALWYSCIEDIIAIAQKIKEDLELDE